MIRFVERNRKEVVYNDIMMRKNLFSARVLFREKVDDYRESLDSGCRVPDGYKFWKLLEWNQDDKKYYYKPYEEGEGYVYIFKIVEVSWGLRNFIDREREWGKRYRSFLS